MMDRIMGANGIWVVSVILVMVVVAFLLFSFIQGSEISDLRNDQGDTPPSRSIEEVKADWEDQLLTIPGVMGVGIGLTKDGKEQAIKVYVNQLMAFVVKRIPREIEGYPVEVEIRGIFRAW